MVICCQQYPVLLSASLLRNAYVRTRRLTATVVLLGALGSCTRHSTHVASRQGRGKPGFALYSAFFRGQRGWKSAKDRLDLHYLVAF
ncbi:hypothetical protein FJTKL_05562 [Diaporthe vaccinii]|uniref:Secreted protein n=1 Tax=Diaporthe vaccinii TaxID=105482 RepID=A0ABR4FGB4_9PEZI